MVYCQAHRLNKNKYARGKSTYQTKFTLSLIECIGFTIYNTQTSSHANQSNSCAMLMQPKSPGASARYATTHMRRVSLCFMSNTNSNHKSNNINKNKHQLYHIISNKTRHIREVAVITYGIKSCNNIPLYALISQKFIYIFHMQNV